MHSGLPSRGGPGMQTQLMNTDGEAEWSARLAGPRLSANIPAAREADCNSRHWAAQRGHNRGGLTTHRRRFLATAPRRSWERPAGSPSMMKLDFAFLMYLCAITANGQADAPDRERFRQEITTREIFS